MADLNTQIRDYFEATVPAVEASQAFERPAQHDRALRPVSGWVVAITAAVAVVLAIGVPVLLLRGGDGGAVATQAPVPSTTAAPTTTVAAATPLPITLPVVDGGAVFVEPPPPAPADVLASGVAYARSGDTLWAWDADGGVAGYRDGAWRSLPPLPGMGLDVAGTLDGTVWALTRTPPGPSAQSTLWYLEEGIWNQLPQDRVLPTGIEDAEDVEVDEATGIVWLGDPNGVLHRWTGAEMTTSGNSPVEMVLDRIAVTGDGTVWASRFNPFFPQLPAGLLRYYPDTDTWESVRPLGGDVDVPAILAGTPDGNLWVLLADVLEWPPEPLDQYPSTWALAYFDNTADEWTIYRVPAGASGHVVADGEVVWLTHSPLDPAEPMVARFDRTTWTTYQWGPTIDSLGIGDDGTLWVSIHPTNMMQQLVTQDGSRP